MTSVSAPALGALLAPLSLDTFFRRYFPERHVTVHGGIERLPAFFRSELLTDPRALSRAYRGPIFVTQRGLGQYEVTGAEARAHFEDLGLSVGFKHVETLLPGADEWLRALESELGMPRGVAALAAFVNAPGSGLAAHCDPQDQIAIHVRGPKSFRVMKHPARFARMQHAPGQPARPEWMSQSTSGLHDAATLPIDSERIDLQPGSVLFTPRGTYHETLAGDSVAVTAVLAFRTLTPAELLARHLLRTLSQSTEWHRTLEQAWSPDPARNCAARERMSAMLAELAPHIASMSVAEILAEE